MDDGSRTNRNVRNPLEVREMNRKHVPVMALWLPVVIFAGACKPGSPGETAPAVEEERPAAGTEPVAAIEEAAPAEGEAAGGPSVDQDRPAVTVKVKAPTPAPAAKAADHAAQTAQQAQESPVKKPEKVKKPTPILIHDSEPKTEFDKCMKLCGEQNMMRAVAWEVIEADCRAECKKKP